MVRAVTLRFRTTTDLDFNKRYNISAFGHHRSQSDATTCPECPGMSWTTQVGSPPDHSLTTDSAPRRLGKRKGFYRVQTSSQTSKPGRFPQQASKCWLQTEVNLGQG